jgi:hypothetical protein
MSLMQRVGAIFTDGRTWTMLFYMILMLPLGIIYFVFSVVPMVVSLAFIASPIGLAFDDSDKATINWGFGSHAPGWGDAIVLSIIGIFLLFATLHLVRALGKMHGAIAKGLLVRSDDQRA